MLSESSVRVRVRSFLALALAVASGGFPRSVVADDASPGRPPAVPLVACDPYFSVWSFADRLNDDVTRHWTGKAQALSSLVRIDGKSFRLMGPGPDGVPPLPQVGLLVLPTRTIYDFQGPEVHVTLTFLTPSLPEDLEVLSRPLTYLTWDVRAIDGKDHAVSLYFSASAELAVDTPNQRVAWSRGAVDWPRSAQGRLGGSGHFTPKGGRPQDRLGPRLRRGATEPGACHGRAGPRLLTVVRRIRPDSDRA